MSHSLPPFKRLVIASAVLAVLNPVVGFAEVVETEAITVFGEGQTRQVNTINRSDIQQSVPGTSPLKVLEKLPSVSSSPPTHSVLMNGRPISACVALAVGNSATPWTTSLSAT